MSKIVFLDLESTGVDVVKDRIVQIAARKMNHDFTEEEEVKKYLVNPGVPIPKEASDIHGITDEMVADQPTFAQRAVALNGYLQGCIIAGYNIIGFDVPMLSEEFGRCNINWPEDGAMFADAYVIFRQKEKRDLEAALMFYTGEQHEGAHDAGADILATEKVFKAQLKHYEDLKGMTIQEVHQFCQGDVPRLDLAGKIILKDGVAVYSFGKDIGKSVKENPGFGHWMLDPKNSFPKNTRDVVLSLIGPPPVKKWNK